MTEFLLEHFNTDSFLKFLHLEVTQRGHKKPFTRYM